LTAALASQDLPVRIGFEATGNYHRPLAHHLGQAGFDLKLVSSVGLARTREALHNSWDKNDPKDAHSNRLASSSAALVRNQTEPNMRIDVLGTDTARPGGLRANARKRMATTCDASPG
jgi:transposase